MSSLNESERVLNDTYLYSLPEFPTSERPRVRPQAGRTLADTGAARFERSLNRSGLMFYAPVDLIAVIIQHHPLIDTATAMRFLC